MKESIIAFLFMLVINALSGQIANIDSLRQALTLSREDTNRVLICQELAYSFAIKRLDSALIYADKGIELSKKLKFPKGEALCLLRQAIYYRLRGASAQGMQHALKALPIFEKQGDIDNIMLSNLLISWTLEDQGFPKLANDYVLKITPVAIAHKSEWLRYCYSTLCTNYNILNVLDSALIFGLKADTIVPDDMFNVSSIGDIYLKMNKMPEARKYFSRVLAYEKTHTSTSYVFNKLVKLYYQENKIDSAIYFAKKAIAVEQTKRKSITQLHTAATLLAELYHKKGIKDSVATYMQLIIDTKDILAGQEKMNLLSLFFNEQLQHQEMESQQLQYEKKVQIFALIATLILFSLIAFIFYHRNKQKQKDALFNQRLHIAADMHDDIGSDLSALNLKTEMIRRNLKAGNQPLSEIDNLVDFTRDIAKKVREVIWTVNVRHDSLSSIISYFDTYADDFFEPTNIIVRTTLPPAIPKMDINGESRKVLLMCFKESLNNVLKHAKASHLTIIFTIDNHALTISIQDNGVGFDPSVLMASTATHGDGLLNMPARMTVIGGQCRIKTSPQGTLVVFSLPI